MKTPRPRKPVIPSDKLKAFWEAIPEPDDGILAGYPAPEECSTPGISSETRARIARIKNPHQSCRQCRLKTTKINKLLKLIHTLKLDVLLANEPMRLKAIQQEIAELL